MAGKSGFDRYTVRVLGYREFMRAVNRTDPDTKRAVKATLARAGEVVRSDAAGRFAAYDARSAAGFKSNALTRAVFVGQRLRKTTGRRGAYGALQMEKALLPALKENTAQIERDFERAMGEVCDHFSRG